jgi:hypothetical protein
VHCIVLNGEGGAASERVSHLTVSGRLPLAASSIRGAVIDGWIYSPSLLSDAVRALRRGGRLAAPAHVPVPAEIQELARDETEWVGEATSDRIAPMVGLTRR